MRRIIFSSLILVTVILVLAAIFGWLPSTVRDGAHKMTPYINLIVFSIIVFGIALWTWCMRSWVESDPDPFFLNLTFFAFAGQCIRTSEFFHDGNVIQDGYLSNILLILLLFGALVVVFQVNVMRAHMRETKEYYIELLQKYRKDGCSDPEIEHWAGVLLRITGTDFSPGIYGWLKGLLAVFPTEPRAKSRVDAHSILPGTSFRKSPPDDEGLTAGLMAVPSERRYTLWHLYWGTCVVSWIIFAVAIWFSQK
jgi:hypothetical protein